MSVVVEIDQKEEIKAIWLQRGRRRGETVDRTRLVNQKTNNVGRGERQQERADA